MARAIAWGFGLVAMVGCGSFAADDGGGPTSSGSAVGVPCGAATCKAAEQVCCFDQANPAASTCAASVGACSASTAPLACVRKSDCGEAADVVCCLSTRYVGQDMRAVSSDCRTIAACASPNDARVLCDPKVDPATGCPRDADGKTNACIDSVVIGRPYSDCGFGPHR